MVTLADLFEADIDGIGNLMDTIVVEVSEMELRQIGLPLNEAHWIPSAVKGLWLRIDAARPEMKQRRHVHVAQKKHIRAPHNQASWNVDQTRHDRNRFDVKFSKRADVQQVARSALGLSPDAILENCIPRAEEVIALLEGFPVYEPNCVFFADGHFGTASDGVG